MASFDSLPTHAHALGIITSFLSGADAVSLLLVSRKVNRSLRRNRALWVFMLARDFSAHGCQIELKYQSVTMSRFHQRPDPDVSSATATFERRLVRKRRREKRAAAQARATYLDRLRSTSKYHQERKRNYARLRHGPNVAMPAVRPPGLPIWADALRVAMDFIYFLLPVPALLLALAADIWNLTSFLFREGRAHPDSPRLLLSRTIFYFPVTLILLGVLFFTPVAMDDALHFSWDREPHREWLAAPSVATLRRLRSRRARLLRLWATTLRCVVVPACRLVRFSKLAVSLEQYAAVLDHRICRLTATDGTEGRPRQVDAESAAARPSAPGGWVVRQGDAESASLQAAAARPSAPGGWAQDLTGGWRRQIPSTTAGDETSGTDASSIPSSEEVGARTSRAHSAVSHDDTRRPPFAGHSVGSRSGDSSSGAESDAAVGSDSSGARDPAPAVAWRRSLDDAGILRRPRPAAATGRQGLQEVGSAEGARPRSLRSAAAASPDASDPDADLQPAAAATMRGPNGIPYRFDDNPPQLHPYLAGRAVLETSLGSLDPLPPLAAAAALLAAEGDAYRRRRRVHHLFAGVRHAAIEGSLRLTWRQAQSAERRRLAVAAVGLAREDRRRQRQRERDRTNSRWVIAPPPADDEPRRAWAWAPLHPLYQQGRAQAGSVPWALGVTQQTVESTLRGDGLATSARAADDALRWAADGTHVVSVARRHRERWNDTFLGRFCPALQDDGNNTPQARRVAVWIPMVALAMLHLRFLVGAVDNAAVPFFRTVGHAHWFAVGGVWVIVLVALAGGGALFAWDSDARTGVHWALTANRRLFVLAALIVPFAVSASNLHAWMRCHLVHVPVDPASVLGRQLAAEEAASWLRRGDRAIYATSEAALGAAVAGATSVLRSVAGATAPAVAFAMHLNLTDFVVDAASWFSAEVAGAAAAIEEALPLLEYPLSYATAISACVGAVFLWAGAHFLGAIVGLLQSTCKIDYPGYRWRTALQEWPSVPAVLRLVISSAIMLFVASILLSPLRCVSALLASNPAPDQYLPPILAKTVKHVASISWDSLFDRTLLNTSVAGYVGSAQSSAASALRGADMHWNILATAALSDVCSTTFETSLESLRSLFILPNTLPRLLWLVLMDAFADLPAISVFIGVQILSSLILFVIAPLSEAIVTLCLYRNQARELRNSNRPVWVVLSLVMFGLAMSDVMFSLSANSWLPATTISSRPSTVLQTDRYHDYVVTGLNLFRHAPPTLAPRAVESVFFWKVVRETLLPVFLAPAKALQGLDHFVVGVVAPYFLASVAWLLRLKYGAMFGIALLLVAGAISIIASIGLSTAVVLLVAGTQTVHWTLAASSAVGIAGVVLVLPLTILVDVAEVQGWAKIPSCIIVVCACIAFGIAMRLLVSRRLSSSALLVSCVITLAAVCLAAVLVDYTSAAVFNLVPTVDLSFIELPRGPSSPWWRNVVVPYTLSSLVTIWVCWLWFVVQYSCSTVRSRCCYCCNRNHQDRRRYHRSSCWSIFIEVVPILTFAFSSILGVMLHSHASDEHQGHHDVITKTEFTLISGFRPILQRIVAATPELLIFGPDSANVSILISDTPISFGNASVSGGLMNISASTLDDNNSSSDVIAPEVVDTIENVTVAPRIDLDWRSVSVSPPAHPSCVSPDACVIPFGEFSTYYPMSGIMPGELYANTKWRSAFVSGLAWLPADHNSPGLASSSSRGTHKLALDPDILSPLCGGGIYSASRVRQFRIWTSELWWDIMISAGGVFGQNLDPAPPLPSSDIESKYPAPSVVQHAAPFAREPDVLHQTLSLSTSRTSRALFSCAIESNLSSAVISTTDDDLLKQLRQSHAQCSYEALIGLKSTNAHAELNVVNNSVLFAFHDNSTTWTQRCWHWLIVALWHLIVSVAAPVPDFSWRLVLQVLACYVAFPREAPFLQWTVEISLAVAVFSTQLVANFVPSPRYSMAAVVMPLVDAGALACVLLVCREWHILYAQRIRHLGDEVGRRANPMSCVERARIFLIVACVASLCAWLVTLAGTADGWMLDEASVGQYAGAPVENVTVVQAFFDSSSSMSHNLIARCHAATRSDSMRACVGSVDDAAKRLSSLPAVDTLRVLWSEASQTSLLDARLEHNAQDDDSARGLQQLHSSGAWLRAQPRDTPISIVWWLTTTAMPAVNTSNVTAALLALQDRSLAPLHLRLTVPLGVVRQWRLPPCAAGLIDESERASMSPFVLGLPIVQSAEEPFAQSRASLLHGACFCIPRVALTALTTSDNPSVLDAPIRSHQTSSFLSTVPYGGADLALHAWLLSRGFYGVDDAAALTALAALRRLGAHVCVAACAVTPGAPTSNATAAAIPVSAAAGPAAVDNGGPQTEPTAANQQSSSLALPPVRSSQAPFVAAAAACGCLTLLALQQALEWTMMLCVSRNHHYSWLYPLWLRRLVPNVGGRGVFSFEPPLAVNVLQPGDD